jgi:hypothetical protein
MVDDVNLYARRWFSQERDQVKKITVLLMVFQVLLTATAMAQTVYPDWSDRTFSPVEISPPWSDPNPVITRDDVTDFNADFVADPFLFHEGDTWYMFFEVSPFGVDQVIALATSPDGLDWTYDRVVLQEDFDLSYPLVFKWRDYYYLVPCIHPDPMVRLYRSKDDTFPYTWQPVADILEGGEDWADATIFRFQGLWWMFVSNGGSDCCWLFYSDELENPAAWTEHPASPIVTAERRWARPGGRTLVLEGGRIIRFVQDCYQEYGEKLRVFEVDVLTTTEFSQHELPESPILQPTGDDAWNGNRMHHCDPWWTGSRWLCSVDGKYTHWAIGIYVSDGVSGGLPPPATDEVSLGCNPNPFNPETRINIHLPQAAEACLRIYDCRGGEVVTLVNGDLTEGWWRFNWRGRDRTGAALPTGVYLARLDTGGRTLSTKLVLLK